MKQKIVSINLIGRKKNGLLLRRVRLVLIVCFIFFIGIYLKDFIGIDGTVKSLDFPIKGVAKNFAGRENLVNYDRLETEIENYIKDYKGRYGVYYYDINTGDEFGIDDEYEYVAASTIKIPLNLYLYEGIKSGSINPDSKMTYIKEDYEEGTGKLQFEEFGSQYSVRNLSKLSITISDNVATNMLIRLVGMYNLKDYMRQLGGRFVDYEQNISSPKDMGLYMAQVYEFYRNNEEIGKELMDDLLNTQFNDRLPALLPKTVKVAHKIGTQTNVINDVGIVFTENPYIVSIMSKDIDEKEAPGVLANISKLIYDFVTE